MNCPSMRVLHIQKAAGIGGSERHLLALLPELTRAGIDIHFATLAAPGAEVFVEDLQEAGIEVTTIGAGPTLNPSALLKLSRLARSFRADIVHTHLIHADVHGQIAATAARVPGVSSVHGTPAFYGREPYRSGARLAGRLARRTIAISDHIRDVLERGRIVPRERIRVVKYGIRADTWEPAQGVRNATRQALDASSDDTCVVGVASRLVPHKGHATLIEAFKRLAPDRPGLRLAIAGDGPLREELEQQAKTLPSGSVVFLGFVKEIGEFMAACDMLVFPTLPEFGEGFGLATLEAMASGLPVVASRTASLPEIVIDGLTGFLVEPGSPGALSEAISRLASDDVLRKTMGTAARKRTEETFSLEAMVAGTLAVYDEVIPKSVARP